MSKEYLEMPRDSAWTFKNANVANMFDDHVREQLPWYDVVTAAVRHLILAYMPENGVLYDMGCSIGNLTHGFEALEGRNVAVYPFDNSPEMMNLYQGMGFPIMFDIAKAADIKTERPNVIVFFLTLMFIPPASRPALVMWAMQFVKNGGAVIIVDKAPSIGGYLGTVLSRMAMKFKLLAGAKSDAILQKELSLNGVQVPIDMSRHTSFVNWFRIGEFTGYIFEKAEL